MTIGIQELLAIIIVAAVVGFALFRRLKKKAVSTDSCSGCEHNSSQQADEKPVHYFKKQR